jgi:hypothetical protein
MIHNKKGGGAQGHAHMVRQGKAGKRGVKRRIPYYLKKSKNEKRVRMDRYCVLNVKRLEDNSETMVEANGCLTFGSYQDPEPRPPLPLYQA